MVDATSTSKTHLEPNQSDLPPFAQSPNNNNGKLSTNVTQANLSGKLAAPRHVPPVEVHRTPDGAGADVS